MTAVMHKQIHKPHAIGLCVYIIFCNNVHLALDWTDRRYKLALVVKLFGIVRMRILDELTLK